MVASVGRPLAVARGGNFRQVGEEKKKTDPTGRRCPDDTKRSDALSDQACPKRSDALSEKAKRCAVGSHPRNENTRATMPPVRNPAPQPIASLTSVMMLLPKVGRRRSPLTAPLNPQSRRPIPRPIAITAKILASRRPTTGLISPQTNRPTKRSPEKTSY